MFDQSKVVLIGCLAAFASLLDNFLPSIAGESSVYSHSMDAPQSVRISRQLAVPMVRPVAPTREITRKLELERMAHPPLPPPPDPVTAWMQDMNERILEKWKTHCAKNEHLIVEFKVRKDGTAWNIHVARSSGNQQTDEDAIRSIEQASPFKALWPNFEPESIRYTFQDPPVK